MRMKNLPASDQEAAEMVGRRRARALLLLVIAYVAIQINFSTILADVGWAAKPVQVVAWIILSSSFVIVLYTGGKFPKSRPGLLPLIDDEVTRQNRSKAIAAGFLASVLTTLALFIYSNFGELMLRQATHLILTSTVSVAALRFALLERKSYQQ
ncbi:hypothetical protein GCM10009127_12090 [Alteraurantiacibacter aestuarii]|uniref:Uncharacterized protein n=1 Tax=Alteraurantiacibacter aestuarii TaxID=650004 RepID=A0A844ZJ33_9SPHN|nr:hypothetical protein [Alteraurantiacibacter aestuarii]MXO87594.1 hypothetical protein [Alteraurantiacibacter aestuarii]